ncbi:hypothetical protein V7149_00240 [Bacillus sp. JJ1503]|uniref:hypothetical protein n=1 Tax=Bacillus sp. JJ1503 TaxID=3122956 RepID=UPI00300025B5
MVQNYICGHKMKEVVVDITRKSDRKTAENVIVKHCEICNVYYVDFEVISFE